MPAEAPLANDWAAHLISPSDTDLENLAFTTFIDGNERFRLGAGDQASASAAFSYLHRREPGSEVLVLAPPRGAHDLALCIAVTAQVTQLSRLSSALSAMFCPWKGSIVVVGHNTAVQRRLGDLRVSGVHTNGGVANALRTYRVRTDGGLSAPDGTIDQHGGGPGRLLYMNTRIQWPSLPSERDPLVIIDATRIGKSANVGRALEWADEHGARHVIVVAHLGDSGPFFDLERANRQAYVFDLAADIRQGLVHELGHGDGDAVLSTNELLHLSAPSLRVRLVESEAIADHLFSGLTALSAAPGNRDSWPYAVARAHRLLTALRRLTDDVENYNRAAAVDPYLPDLGSACSAVARTSELPRVHRRWRTFATAQWGTARLAAVEAYRMVADSNPKLEALVDEVDRALRDPDRIVLVRTADRAGAAALPATLCELLGEEATKRVKVVRCGEVLPWLPADATPVTEIFPGAPPAWDNSWLYTGESTDRIVLAYPFEVRWIERAMQRHLQRAQKDREAFFARFGLGTAPHLAVALDCPDGQSPSKREQIVLDAGDLWERILEVDAPPPDPYTATDRTVRHGNGTPGPSLRVDTDDGRTHIVPCALEVEVFVGGKYRIRLADELQVGDTMLYTTGTGRESLFTRLVSASHRVFGVDDLDIVMRRFRDACRRIHADAGSWAEGNRRIVAAGADAGTQLQAWATGDTIAPASANDVLVVAKLARDERLTENWYRIEALATELRSMHQRLGRVLSAAISEALEGGGPHVRKVTELVGADAAEILDEFKSAKITAIEGT